MWFCEEGFGDGYEVLMTRRGMLWSSEGAATERGMRGRWRCSVRGLCGYGLLAEGRTVDGWVMGTVSVQGKREGWWRLLLLVLCGG